MQEKRLISICSSRNITKLTMKGIKFEGAFLVKECTLYVKDLLLINLVPD